MTKAIDYTAKLLARKCPKCGGRPTPVFSSLSRNNWKYCAVWECSRCFFRLCSRRPDYRTQGGAVRWVLRTLDEIEAGRAALRGGWVSVKDRRPKMPPTLVRKRWLVTDGKEMWLESSRPCYWNIEGDRCEHITHWQELSALPGEE